MCSSLDKAVVLLLRITVTFVSFVSYCRDGQVKQTQASLTRPVMINPWENSVKILTD